MVKKHRPHDELRAEILAVATKAVTEGGASAVSARSIAQAVDVSVGTIYNLFGHLDGLVRAVNFQHMQDLYGLLSEAVQQAGDSPEDRLLAMGETYLKFAQASPRRWETLFRYEAETPTEDRLDQAEDALFALLQSASGKQESKEVLSALWAAVHGVVELAIGRRLTLGRDKPLDHIHLIIKAGLRGVQALRAEGGL
ncbi:MAG: TetR/AcrR family transcriptional regulator [Pseudomonadota bacterium]